MVFNFEKYVIDIDTEKTEAYYRTENRITCDCLGCRNFDRVATELPPEVLAFFEKLGVDPVKPEVLSIDYAPSKETMAYSGFYYLCGVVIRGENPWKQVGDGCFQLDDQYTLPIGRDFFVWFAAPHHGILDLDFPKPVMEMSFSCIFPWRMEQPHGYHRYL